MQRFSVAKCIDMKLRNRIKCSNPLIIMVPGAGLEPARCCHRRILSPKDNMPPINEARLYAGLLEMAIPNIVINNGVLALNRCKNVAVQYFVRASNSKASACLRRLAKPTPITSITYPFNIRRFSHA